MDTLELEWPIRLRDTLSCESFGLFIVRVGRQAALSKVSKVVEMHQVSHLTKMLFRGKQAY